MSQNCSLPLNQVIHGNCLEVLLSFPERSVDLVFADPPYNLQLQQELWRPNRTKVDAVLDDWDRFDGFHDYDQFTREWLTACRRLLKDTGTIWVIGSYHNIYRVGSLMQDLHFWFLNDVTWLKTNPMPNFRGVRFTNSHETLLWACKEKGARYTFNHHAMKSLNDDLQMRSDWVLPICSGAERIKVNGRKAHSTQKPEALLYRILLASSQPGDIVLDPFFGTGTTGAVAKKLHRRWIGIEKEAEYVEIARQRIEQILQVEYQPEIFEVKSRRQEPRISVGNLLENGLLYPGQQLFFKADPALSARLKADGKVICDGLVGSIHQVGRHLLGRDQPEGRITIATPRSPATNSCNGWESWYFREPDGSLHPLDELRQALRQRLAPLSQEREFLDSLPPMR